MRSLAISSAIAATAIAVMSAAPASAQATRTWVSGVGDDVNPCSRTAPCKTFAGAISKTFINGEINCLDPAGYGAVTITKSMTIDCGYTNGSILSSGTNGVIININVNANDPLRTVRLRGLSINGAGASGSVGTRTGVRGVSILQAQNVFMDDMLITTFSQQGVNAASTVANSKTYIRNSIIRDNASSGIASVGAATHSLVIENVSSLGNLFGVAVGNGNNAMVSRSVMSGNSNAGVEVDPSGQVNVNDTVISHNATGVLASAGGTVRLSNNDISFNSTGITGATTSFGNNRISGSGGGGNGVAPTAAGADSAAKGQQ